MGVMPILRGNKNGLLSILALIIKGAIIGVGGILPGISGGVLCVVFNIYEPLMELLSHPFKTFKKHYKLLIPVVIGVGLGFVGFAGLVGYIMKLNGTATVCAFVGLILGTMPELWKEAKGAEKKRSWQSILAMCISFVVLLSILLFLQFGAELKVTPNIFWYGFCGIAWGISMVVPGMSSSSILFFFGLYEPMLDGISRLAPGVIIPLACGIAVILLLLPRLVNILMKRYRCVVFHAVFGIVLATLVPILPYQFGSAAEFMIDLICIVGGFFAAYFLNKLFKKWENQADKAELPQES